MIHRLTDWFMPPTPVGRRLGVFILVLPVAVYIVRFLVEITFFSQRGPAGLFGFPFCIPLLFWLAIIIISASVIISLAVESVRAARHPAPLLAIITGLLIALWLPMLYSPPPYPEEIILADRRADFEQAIQLIKQYPSMNTLPSKFYSLSVKGRVYTYTDKENVLTVEFEPTDFYYPLVYFENPTHPEDSEACGTDGYVTRRIDDHWFLCEREWN